MEWPLFGLRDGMLLVVALAAVYLVVMLLKLVQVGRQRHVRVGRGMTPAPVVETVSPLRRRAGTGAAQEPELPVSPVVAAATYAETAAVEETAVLEPSAPTEPREPYAVPPVPTFDWDDVRDLFGDVAESPDVSRPAAAPAVRRPGPEFGEHLAEHLARSDVEMEVQRMRDEMQRMRAEVEELRAARRVSPQYSEAMELIQRGMPAQAVADRLGISLAEAELVQALSRGGKNFEEGEEHGADGYAKNDGFDAFDERPRRFGG